MGQRLLMAKRSGKPSKTARADPPPRPERPTIQQGIYDLLQSVEVDTKELGRAHVEPWPSQRMVIDAIAQGMQEDVHEFVILKCRQVACCLAPDTRVLTADLQ